MSDWQAPPFGGAPAGAQQPSGPSGPKSISTSHVIVPIAQAVSIANEDQSRVRLLVYNFGSQVAWIGHDQTVTADSGFPIPAGAVVGFDTHGYMYAVAPGGITILYTLAENL